VEVPPLLGSYAPPHVEVSRRRGHPTCWARKTCFCCLLGHCMPHLCGVSTPRSNQRNSRPPKGIAPRIGVGCQSFTLPSSANYDCDEDCNDVTLHWHSNYIAHHNKVKLPSSGLGRDDGQSLRAAYCAACRALPRCAMLTTSLFENRIPRRMEPVPVAGNRLFVMATLAREK
jgi:hypothetical protein